jgi:hypothetical protein
MTFVNSTRAMDDWTMRFEIKNATETGGHLRDSLVHTRTRASLVSTKDFIVSSLSNRRVFVLCLLSIAALSCSGTDTCSGSECNDESATGVESDDDANDPDANDPVQYVGGTTDEALEHLLDASATQKAGFALSLDAPTGSDLAKQTPALFSFRKQSQTGIVPPALRGRSLETDSVLPHWFSRGLRELAELIGPERVAHAHGTPYNGEGYFLSFDDKAGTPLLQVFTSSTSFTPSQPQWDQLAAAGQPLKLSIVWATFEENEVAEGGGPYLGLEYQFTIR